MWSTLCLSRRAVHDPDFAASVEDLLQSTTRNLILATSGIYLIWHFIATGTWGAISGQVWLISVIILPTSALALRWLPKHLLVAQVIWLASLFVAITVAVFLFQQPEIALLYALLPLLATATIGWPSGLISEGILIVLVLCFAYWPIGQPLSIYHGIGIIVGGLIAWAVGWASTHALLIVTRWSLFSLERAQRNTEEARASRAELARVAKDLDQAYFRLERANHMLILARAEAEAAKDARNHLTLAISHELRTPLNFILGFSELMVNSPATYAELDQWPKGLHEDVQEIYRSSNHLLQLVNDVLDLGRTEALQMPLLKEWVDPAQIIAEVDAMVRPAFQKKRLYFQAEVEPGLPAVFVDHTRIRQVLLNLASNSIRFTDRGGVTVGVRRDDGDLLFCVQDTGPGIAEEDLPKLFEPFQQAGNDSWWRREGFGLGLPISRRFIELHGGRIWVESRLGEGTCFYFTIPLPGAAQASLAANSSPSDAQYWSLLKEKAERGRSILVLSTDPSAAKVIARYVEDYHVVTVQDLKQVCACVSEILPSALILDRALFPEAELRAVLQELPYDLPIISFPFPDLVGYTGQLPEGVSGYLVKPVERRALVEAIRALRPDLYRLLVVDDDPAMIRFIAQVLNSMAKEGALAGYCRLATALTGMEALAQVEAQKPDAVLLDLALPDISGWEVLEQLKRKRIPVILVTATERPRRNAEEEQRETLQVTMRRALSHHELPSVLRSLLGTIHPAYPTIAGGPARPADPSE